MQTSTEQQALIKQLNVIDDVFFHKITEDNAVCEEILRIILQKPKLKVIDAQPQRFLRNIGAHSVILEDGSDIAELMQYFKNSTGINNKFPKLSDRVYYFKESKEGAEAMTQVVEDYFKKRISEQMSEHDKETVKVLLQNGASVDLIKKSFPTISVEYIEKLDQQLSVVGQ